MISINVKVLNQHGLHARPSALFAKECKRYCSNIELENKGEKVNAKRLTSLLSAKIAHNDDIIIHIDGEDEETAAAKLPLFLGKLRD